MGGAALQELDRGDGQWPWEHLHGGEREARLLTELPGFSNRPVRRYGRAPGAQRLAGEAEQMVLDGAPYEVGRALAHIAKAGGYPGSGPWDAVASAAAQLAVTDSYIDRLRNALRAILTAVGGLSPADAQTSVTLGVQQARRFVHASVIAQFNALESIGLLDEVRAARRGSADYTALTRQLWPDGADLARNIEARHMLVALQEAVERNGDAGVRACVGESAYAAVARKVAFYGGQAALLSTFSAEDWRRMLYGFRDLGYRSLDSVARHDVLPALRRASTRAQRPGTTYWTEERLRAELEAFIAGHPQVSTLEPFTLRQLGRSDLIGALAKHGGQSRWEREVGIVTRDELLAEQRQQTHDELLTLLASRREFPRRAELQALGKDYLWTYMSRNGAPGMSMAATRTQDWAKALGFTTRERGRWVRP